jgi:hypothetical protein
MRCIHLLAIATALLAAAPAGAAEDRVAPQATPQPAARAPHRRLNRREYEHTLRDLLDLPGLAVRDMLPEDGRGHGFDKSGAALELSPVHIAAYRDAAAAAIAMATASQAAPPEQVTLRLLPGAQDFFKLALVEGDAVFLRDGKYDSTALPIIREALPHKLAHYEKSGLFPYRHSVGVFRRQGVNDHFALFFTEFTAAKPGNYRLRLSVWSFLWEQGALAPLDKPEAVSLHANDRLIGYFDAPSLAAKTHEITAWLNPGDKLLFTAASIPPARVYQRPGRAAEYVGPGIAIDHIDVEGPLHESWPPKSHRRLFGELPARSAPAPADLKRLLGTFLSRAFRRPATATELASYAALVNRRLKQGDSFEQALSRGHQAALCGPEFLFLAAPAGPLDDWQLASRLSYFLWDSMPDDELFALAGRGQLKKPEVLRSQVNRMLDDPKSARFIEHFLDEWLDLREIDFTTPDGTLYPEYSTYLRDSMLAETRGFFRELIDEDVSATGLVDSDFLMVNQKLAEHYALEPAAGRAIVGSAIRRVPLPAGSPRGGLLGQASVLKVTSNGTVTSPVKRGVWLLREILDQPPEPPPPGIPAVDADVRGSVTIREQLALHAADAGCASCHAAIDPPGFALENFDVIGGWRQRYRVLPAERADATTYAEGPPVDPSCVLADGRECASLADFRRALLADPRSLARNLVRQLIVYATGADVSAADHGEIEAIVDRAAAQDYGVRTLIQEVVASRIFLEQ